jgi:hypothetical protein
MAKSTPNVAIDQTDQTDQYLTYEEAATYTGKNKQQIGSAIRGNRFKAIFEGRTGTYTPRGYKPLPTVHKEALDAWVAALASKGSGRGGNHRTTKRLTFNVPRDRADEFVAQITSNGFDAPLARKAKIASENGAPSIASVQEELFEQELVEA